MLQKRDEPGAIRVDGMLHPQLVSDGFTRLRPGAYVDDAAWAALFTEDRLRLLNRAVWSALQNEKRALTHLSAAVEHGLPLYRTHSDKVDMALPETATRRNGSHLQRHHVPLPDEDVTVLDGMRVTTLDRTVYDIIRSVSLEAAVVAFDAALHRVAWDDETNEYDAVAAEEFRKKVVKRIQRHPGARGIRQARFVADFADGRAGSPGESVSRLWMWELGVPAPQLQFRVQLAANTYALLDFAWPALGKWGEFDGALKYDDPRIRAGRSVDEVLAQQAARQTAIERVTTWTCERWGTPQLTTIAEFAKVLRCAGLLPGAAD